MVERFCKELQISDQRRVTYWVQGSGRKLVVCEAGLGLSGQYWFLLMNQIATDYKVISYNRSGIGLSSPDKKKRTLQRLADDLNELISHQDFDELILVGHSWGAPIIRTASLRLDNRLKKLVLVDPSDEHLIDDYKPLSLKLQANMLVLFSYLHLLSPLYKKILTGLPSDIQKQILRDITTINAARESGAELKNLRSGLSDLTQLMNVQNYTTVIISGTKTMTGETDAMREKIIQAHGKSAKENASARHILASRSSHTVPITEPELIAKMIRDDL